MPLDEMTIAGIFDAVSSFDSCGDAIVAEPLGAERAELTLVLRVPPALARFGMIGGPCGAFSSRARAAVRIELATRSV